MAGEAIDAVAPCGLAVERARLEALLIFVVVI
jgi:hypothetical protein